MRQHNGPRAQLSSVRSGNHHLGSYGATGDSQISMNSRGAYEENHNHEAGAHSR